MTRRVLVVGAGSVGLSVALECAKRGFDVTVVDREAQTRRSCSFGNAGFIVPSHFVPLAAPGAMAQGIKWMLDPRAPFRIKPRASLDLVAWLMRFARSATREHVARASPLMRDLCLASRASFAAVVGDIGLAQRGLFVICRTAQALEHEAHIAQYARELGLPAEMVTQSDLAKAEPALRDDVAGAVRYPLDCHLSPGKWMAWLERAVLERGVRIEWQREVTGWRDDGGALRAACTQAGDIDADEFVLCGGSWSPATVRDLHLTIPIEAGKGYSITLPHHDRAPVHSALLTEARVAVTPMNGGVRIGGTMELAGLDRSIDARRVAAIIDAATRYYRVFERAELEAIEPWSGLRPCTPDGLPYVGRTRRYRNLTIAAGHAMMGISLSPVTGTIVGQTLAGEAPAFDMTQLSPDRFA